MRPHSLYANTRLQALDEFILSQLAGIERTFKELSERLGDPDVLSDPKKIMEVSQERASVEEVRHDNTVQ